MKEAEVKVPGQGQKSKFQVKLKVNVVYMAIRRRSYNALYLQLEHKTPL